MGKIYGVTRGNNLKAKKNFAWKARRNEEPGTQRLERIAVKQDENLRQERCLKFVSCSSWHCINICVALEFTLYIQLEDVGCFASEVRGLNM